MPTRKRVGSEFVTHPLGTEIYSVEQVAAALNLSPKYIYNAIRQGKLDARKTGKQYLITREDVRKFWESLPHTSQQKSSGV